MAKIVIEKLALEGVRKVAGKFASDFEEVYGSCPEMVEEESKTGEINFVFLTLGYSEIQTELLKKYGIEISGKRECYQIIKDGQSIYVIGSDKRGSIYGIFDLSEQIGVTPFIYWGDASPLKREKFGIEDICEKVSKEPSVEYRGFFINDEWPCFGNWTTSHFGGFTAEMYDKVFEFLLRMKGNCLWPAMWSSSFALDGPGQLNEELADIYGVVIDYSHHEPCLRASEEWDIYKGEEYGREWNYSTNKDGLLKYWRDGILRSSKYENIITMGMRGERDSKMQGVNTLADCIDFWKDIITEQDELIEKYATNPKNHPKLVAIYKEVEDYFFGNEDTAGLAGWEGLEDKIMMFCEDNFGYMRRLPEGNLLEHKGGLGMYYHLDYHGDPVSYEWINSTPLYKIWEQMSQAYHHGIKKMWMVNVGDLKGNEYPLSFFMAMAYDFETWGDGNPNAYSKYAYEFAKCVFGNTDVAELLTQAVDLIALRKPEALSVNTYSLVHGETDLMIQKCKGLLSMTDIIKEKLSEERRKPYFSMVEYPVKIGLNHILLHLYAKKNEHYARQGKVIANRYARLVGDCYENEKKLKEAFCSFESGKWAGMELAAHTGFTKWNEDGAIKPLRYIVEPSDKPHMLVSKADSLQVARKNYGAPERIIIDDYHFMHHKAAVIEVANDGRESFKAKVTCDNPAFEFSWNEMEIAEQEILIVSIKEEMVDELPEVTEATLTDGDTTVVLELRRPKDYIIIDPLSFKSGDALQMPGYGKHGNGVKLFKGSFADYSFENRNLTEAEIEVCLAPVNPVDGKDGLKFALAINGNEQEIRLLEEGYKAGDSACSQWASGVLNNERRAKISVSLKRGENSLKLLGITPGLIIEKIIIHGAGSLVTYIGV